MKLIINIIFILVININWGLGIGDWGLGPIPNPQSPIPNPLSYKIILYNNHLINVKQNI